MGVLDINGFKDITFSANFTDNLTKYVVFAWAVRKVPIKWVK